MIIANGNAKLSGQSNVGQRKIRSAEYSTDLQADLTAELLVDMLVEF